MADDIFNGFGDPHVRSTEQVDHLLDERYFTLDDVGPGAWYVIHATAALGLYETLLEIFELFADKFVCTKCRRHIQAFKATPFYPPPSNLSNRDLFTWTVNFHNMVNTRLNKGYFTPAGAQRLFGFITLQPVERICGPSTAAVDQLSLQDIHKLELEQALPNFDIGAIDFKNSGNLAAITSAHHHLKSIRPHVVSGDGDSEKYKLNNIMYTVYLLAANGRTAGAKSVLDNVVEPLPQRINPSSSCLTQENLFALSTPLEVLRVLVRRAGDEGTYNVEKLFFELTTQVELDMKPLPKHLRPKLDHHRSEFNYTQKTFIGDLSIF